MELSALKKYWFIQVQLPAVLFSQILMEMSRRGQVKEDQYVGPYRLEKTLGKGQTGNDKLV